MARSFTRCIGALMTMAALASPLGAAPPRLAEQEIAAGRRAFERGAMGRAADHWTRAAALFEEEGDLASAEATRMQLSDAQQALGDPDSALASLRTALESARERGAPAARVAALRGALGNLYASVGATEDARRELEAALELARKAQARSTAAEISNNLANLHARLGDRTAAFAAYRRAAEEADALGQPALSARAHANAARAASEADDAPRTLIAVDEASTRLAALPADHAKATILIHLASSLDRLSPAADATEEDRRLLHRNTLLGQAEAIAAEIGDDRNASWALGYLAALYSERGRRDEALELNRRARLAARRAKATEIEQRWRVQAARIEVQRGDRDAAIEHYAAATELLEGLRQTASPMGEENPSFRESTGAVYFEYVDQLLRRAAESPAPEADLASAQQTVERLKTAELRDYFQDDCVDSVLAREVSAVDASPTTAIVYPILLPDRIEILVSIRGRTWHATTPVPRERVREEIRRLRRMLEVRTTREYLRPARAIHDWLVAPLLARLEAAEIDTLVFVPDGPLRTIPMGVLHDGERFLIERYPVAITPSLSLTDPRSLDRERIRVFAAGLSESVQGQPALPHVRQELASIEALFESATYAGGSS